MHDFIAKAVEVERTLAEAQPISERPQARAACGVELARLLVDHLIRENTGEATFRIGQYELVFRPAHELVTAD